MNYHDLVTELLARLRLSPEERERFLNPDYERDSHDPMLLVGMREAVARVNRAIEKKERIAVYADFDADGIPAAVVLHDFFTKVGHEKLTVYIPHRDREGYGFHAEAVRHLAEQGVSLIITVDVGTTAKEALATAKEVGVEVIVTDHHEPNGEFAEVAERAVAVLNPKRPDETYPFRDLCGAGVAFKLVQGLIATAHEKKLLWREKVPRGWEKWLLDMVALATIADMVPLLGENRVFAKWGLVVLRKTRRIGLHALARKAGFRLRELTEDEVGFSIAPRINAASRMGEPEVAFRLLTARESVAAEEAARELERLNRRRRGVVAAMVKELKQQVAAMDVLPPVVVLGSPSYSPALCGLAASSLVETYGCPVCVWGREGNGTYKGSCRSDGSVSVVKLFEAMGEELLQYGGHAEAGGFSVAFDALHTLPERFAAAYEAAAKHAEAPAEEVAPLVIPLREVNETLLRALEQLRPFGVGNPKPVFTFPALSVASVRHFGKERQHVELMVADEEGSRRRAVAFFKTADAFGFSDTTTACRLTATLERSQWHRAVELRIVALSVVS